MLKDARATITSAAVTLAILCLGAGNPFSNSSRQELLNRLEILEQNNVRLQQEVSDLSRRMDILTARVNDVYGAPAAAASDPVGPDSYSSYTSAPGSPAPNLQVVRLSPQAATPQKKGRLIIAHSDDEDTVIQESPAPLPGTNYVPPPDPETTPPAPRARAATPPPAPVMAKPAPPPQPAADSSQGEAEAYGRIKETWDGGQKDEAATMMASYLKKYPKGVHVDEVAYKLGSYKFDAGEYAAAIDYLHIVTQNHPASSYAADALYLVGVAYLELGNQSKGEEALQDVMVLYPFSAAAPKADQKLSACCR